MKGKVREREREEEIYISSYWMTLRRKKYADN
jgi:hypothetical protein